MIATTVDTKYKEIKLSFFTTSKEEYLQLWEKASSSKYVYKFNSELWNWESGDKLYLVKIKLLVNSKLPQLLIERYLRIKLKVESYTNDLRTNSGECTKEILPEQFNRYEPTVIELRPPKRLKDIDFSKKKRLSLKGTKLSSKERRVDLITPVKVVDRPPTAEEIAYSTLVKQNPLIEELVARFKLVSPKIVAIPQQVQKEPEKPQQIAKKEEVVKQSKIVDLSLQILELENCYRAEDVIEKIVEATKVNIERAKKGFNLMIQEKAIEVIAGDWYILRGSTPF